MVPPKEKDYHQGKYSTQTLIGRKSGLDCLNGLKQKISKFFEEFDLEEVTNKIISLYNELAILSTSFSKRHLDLNLQKNNMNLELNLIIKNINSNKEDGKLDLEEKNLTEKLKDSDIPYYDQNYLFIKEIDSISREENRIENIVNKNDKFLYHSFLFLIESFFR